MQTCNEKRRQRLHYLLMMTMTAIMMMMSTKAMQTQERPREIKQLQLHSQRTTEAAQMSKMEVMRLLPRSAEMQRSYAEIRQQLPRFRLMMTMAMTMMMKGVSMGMAARHLCNQSDGQCPHGQCGQHKQHMQRLSRSPQGRTRACPALSKMEKIQGKSQQAVPQRLCLSLQGWALRPAKQMRARKRALQHLP